MEPVFGLLLKPFSERSWEEKMRIFTAGKPRPELTKANTFIKTTSSVNNDKNFDVSVYDNEPWLTGCEKLQALFCWPCLLFAEEQSLWNSNGFNEFKYFQDGAACHKQTLLHVGCMLSYQMFLYRYSNTIESDVVSHEGKLLERNREIAKCIIDVVCYTVTLQYPPQKGNVSKQFQVEKCVEELLSYKASDSMTKDAIALLKTSPNLLTEIVSAIAEVVREVIKKETKKSTYVSLTMNEHSGISSKSQLSTVIRFLKDGKVIERFLAFTDLDQYTKNAAVVLKYIENVIEMYDLSDRFVAYSCDGAVTASTFHLRTLKASLHEKYPLCSVVPCYYHELNFTLEQSLSHIKKCHAFFNNVNAVKLFFQNNSKACEELNFFLKNGILGLDSDEWSNSEFLRVLKAHRRQFIQFFESIVNKPEVWDAENCTEALAYKKFLQEFDMIFQLQVFSKIFDYTCSVSSSLSSLLPESVFGSRQVEYIQLSLEKEKEEDAFEKFWVSVVAEILEAQEPKPMSLKEAMEYETKLLYREFYIKIIDYVVQEIAVRYSCVKDLDFFHILNYEMHGKFVFSEETLQSLLAVHGSYFDETIMRYEMKVLCGNNSVFAKMSLYSLMEFFIAANLRATFKNLFKLAELTLAMPCKPASSVSGPCKFDRIRAGVTILESSQISQDLNFLCIEKELMLEVKKSSNFIFDVLRTLQQIKKDCRINLDTFLEDLMRRVNEPSEIIPDHSTSPSPTGPKLSVSEVPLVQHSPFNYKRRRRRCAECSKKGIHRRSTVICKDCNVALCIDRTCFEDYHAKLPSVTEVPLVQHSPFNCKRRRRCAECSKKGIHRRSTVICKDCGVALCIDRTCFEDYHAANKVNTSFSKLQNRSTRHKNIQKNMKKPECDPPEKKKIPTVQPLLHQSRSNL